MHSPFAQKALLFLRLLLVWWGIWYVFWVLLIAMAGGGILALIGSMVLSPWPAATLAVMGVLQQGRALKEYEHPWLLTASRRIQIQVPLDPAQATSEVATVLQDELGATNLEAAPSRIVAGFRPPTWQGAWRSWSDSDVLVVDVRPVGAEGGGSELDVLVQPRSQVFNDALWIDGGRNARRLQRFREAMSHRVAQWQRGERAAHRAQTLETRLAQAELLLLRAQVEPHFLFNTLAHLRELVSTGEREMALAMVDHLVTHARAMTERMRHATHGLSAELEGVQSYLDLMALRFGDRLHFGVEVAPEALSCVVPVGVLLIPVENALKHGLEPKVGPGRLSIRGHVAGQHLVLEVEDDGVGLKPHEGSRQGTGLANLRARMRLHHGDAAELHLESGPEGGVCARMKVPIPL